MALIKNGQVGDFTGKIGNVVVAKWKDLTVGRSTPKKSTKPLTLKQLTQQLRFKLVGEFFNRISDLIQIGYQSGTGKLTAVNAAVKEHIDKVIIGVYPNFTLDYPKITISVPFNKAEVDSGFNTKAVPVANHSVEVTWSLSDYANIRTLPTDQLYAAFYSVEQKRFLLYTAGAARSELTTTIRLPQVFIGNTLHAYCFFASADAKLVSYSEYLGSFKLLA